MKPKSLIFDLDDTLVSSNLDFATIREQIGCPPGNDILKFTQNLPLPARLEAEKIIYGHEMRDAESATIIQGVEQVLAELASNSIKLAIVTRNSNQATQIKLQRTGIKVDKVITREDAPPKPAPDALLSIANDWQIKPQDCIYVGDFRYDLEAALNANMHAAWFSNGTSPAPKYSEMAHFSFAHYDEFIERLDNYWHSARRL
ncbi:HAD family phosphatase [Shewanella sp. WXL01]|uniref:HAD family hydrolase n=1 Tax=Shewanella TaxID=22 RepID=UPI0013EE531D|nr:MULTISPECIES: HAD family phosphatase [Shewanella]NKF52725.1 HAD family phosphatase [Shewanella sp. WXL01]